MTRKRPGVPSKALSQAACRAFLVRYLPFGAVGQRFPAEGHDEAGKLADAGSLISGIMEELAHFA
jgi:hypothetical protein